MCAVGGKLELWDLKSKENISSVRAHDNSVTGLKVIYEHLHSLRSIPASTFVHLLTDIYFVCKFCISLHI